MITFKGKIVFIFTSVLKGYMQTVVSLTSTQTNTAMESSFGK